MTAAPISEGEGKEPKLMCEAEGRTGRTVSQEQPRARAPEPQTLRGVKHRPRNE